jgi:hypothetical protein
MTFYIPNEIIFIIFSLLKITDKRLLTRTCKSYNDITKNLIKEAEQNLGVKYFGKYDKYCVEKFTLELCYDGYFDLIPNTYLTNNNKIIIKALVYFGNIDKLKIAVINNNVKWDPRTIAFAYLSNNTEIVKWTLAHNCTYDTYAQHCACSWSAKFGNLDLLKLAIEHNCIYTNLVPAWAAFYGHLHIIIWLKENSFPWASSTVCDWAALGSHLHIIKWLVTNNCPWSTTTCAMASKIGNLRMLQWLHKRGCPWDSRTSTNAAQYGHLSTLKWVMNNDCPYDNDIVQWLTRNTIPDAHIIEWLKNNI